MYSHENLPIDWFTPRSSHYPLPMSRPVSKSFNRISDFIFPDTVHIRCPQQQQYQSVDRGYRRTENYSLPALNRHNQRDLVIVEHLPAEEFGNIDLLYREQPNRQIRRRYSSIIDERRLTSDEANRSAGYRERIRDRRKRHTTDNAYHSMLKSMLEEDEQQYPNDKNSNFILSYKTTLDPITDSESMTSEYQQINDMSHSRVPINGTIPMMTERERTRQRQHSSSISSRDSSSDTDIMERRRNSNHYQQDSSVTYLILFR
jgi:hypothetical protein